MKLTQPLIAIALTGPLLATVTFNESSDGELSGDNLNPTALGTFGVGTSTVSGTIVDALGANPNVDVFTFNVATGSLLSGISVSNFVSTDNVAFLALDNGSSFAFDAVALGNFANSPDQIPFIGGNLFGEEVGSNIIDTIGNGDIGTGFSSPLGEGNYTIYLQQLGGSTVDYTLSFNVTNVPEPSSVAFLALGSLAFLRRKR